MRLALTYSRDLGAPISNHCQDHALCPSGVMAEGWVSSRLGLSGIPAVAEEAMVARDIALAEPYRRPAPPGASEQRRQRVPWCARPRSAASLVTAEVCPHHLWLTDEWALGGKGDAEATGAMAYDTSTKVYPPLRSHVDVEACLAGLVDGTIDCVATDHAPHERASKECTYNDAAFGISVLETALGTLMAPVHRGSQST